MQRTPNYTYNEFQKHYSSTEARCSLYQTLLTLGSQVARIDLEFMERYSEDLSELQRLKSAYPEYLI